MGAARLQRQGGTSGSSVSLLLQHPHVSFAHHKLKDAAYALSLQLDGTVKFTTCTTITGLVVAAIGVAAKST